MDNSALKFVIVGHVDHGKSTLIGRLLYDTGSLPPDKIKEIKEASTKLGRQTEFAFLLDHLREEREQGITIDTAQTFFKTAKREYVIIDAPGHREFVKNMITGASQAEAALLIIDTEQGIQEQTRRHAYILGMLGIDQVVVLLNKMDLVKFDQGRFGVVKGEITSFLASLDIKPEFFIPICAIQGDNVAVKSQAMSWYQGPTVLESLDCLKSRTAAGDKPLVMPIQDFYMIDQKRIVVGRVEAGTIRKGQKIKILPRAETTSVKSVEKYLEKTDVAGVSESIGITTDDAVFLERGNVICEPGKEPLLADSFSANVFWMSRSEFRKDERLTLRLATQETSCKVEKIMKRLDSSSLAVIEEDAAVLKTLEVGEVLIKTKRPLVVSNFNELEELGRFVLVQNENTVAGGIITGI